MDRDEKKDLDRFEQEQKYDKLKRQKFKQEFFKNPLWVLAFIVGFIYGYFKYGVVTAFVFAFVFSFIAVCILLIFNIPKILSSRKSS